MNIQCVICQDLLEPVAHIFITPCGHVFHFACLVQWLEKSESCPQCRQKVRKKQISRVYFTLCNTEAVVEDSFSLQQRVDSLNFKIKLKETEVSKIRDENEDLKKQNSGLRREVKKVESEINEKKSAIHAIKEQMIYFKQLSQESESLKCELSAMKNTLERYQNVETLIKGTQQDVEEMIRRDRNPSNLFTYVSVLRKEIITSVNKRKEMRAAIKRLQQELHTVSMERNFLSEEHSKRKQLEEELATARSENHALEKRLAELEPNGKPHSTERISSSSHENPSPRYCIPRRDKYSRSHENDGDPSPKKLKNSHPATENFNYDSPLNSNSSSSDIVFPTEPRKTKENEENSPVPRMKSGGIMALKEQAALRQAHASSSIRPLHWSSKTSSQPRPAFGWRKQPGSTFDGFGGHSRNDEFPQPSMKLKRSMPDNRGPKKTKFDSGSNKNMNDYIINLT